MRLNFLLVIMCIAHLSIGGGDELYKQGITAFEANPAQALGLFEQAAAEGCVPAMVGAGHCYETGTGVSVDYAKAIEFYEVAVEYKSLKACEGLARIYASCPDSRFHDGEKAVTFAAVLVRANSRDADALSLLAASYARNLEFQKAKDIQMKVCRYSDIKEIDERKIWIRRYEEGMPFGGNASEVWLLKAADRGSVWAMLKIGHQLFESNAPHDLAQARLWFERAASSGCGEGAYTAGLFNWMGFGGDRDKAQALDYFLQAERFGMEDASFWVAYSYTSIRRSAGELNTALRYFRELEGRGDFLAGGFSKILQHQNWWDKILDEDSTENIYQTGCQFCRERTKTYSTAVYSNVKETLPPDYERASVCFIIAAESGHAQAAHKFISLLNQGLIPLSSDSDVALLWKRRMHFKGTFSHGK